MEKQTSTNKTTLLPVVGDVHYLHSDIDVVGLRLLLRIQLVEEHIGLRLFFPEEAPVGLHIRLILDGLQDSGLLRHQGRLTEIELRLVFLVTPLLLVLVFLVTSLLVVLVIDLLVVLVVLVHAVLDVLVILLKAFL